MSGRRRTAPPLLALALAGAAPCGAADISGYVRPEYFDMAAPAIGPLATANRLVPGLAPILSR
jgi:hypothetical protein